jgi:hypothetical protein
LPLCLIQNEFQRANRPTVNSSALAKVGTEADYYVHTIENRR